MLHARRSFRSAHRCSGTDCAETSDSWVESSNPRTNRAQNMEFRALWDGRLNRQDVAQVSLPITRKPFDVSSKGFKVKQSGGQYTHRTILAGRWGVGRGFGSSTVTRHGSLDPLIFMASGESTVPAFDRSTCETPRRKHSDSCNRPVVRPL